MLCASLAFDRDRRILYYTTDNNDWRDVCSFDLKTGKETWNAPHNKSGYRSPEDLIVAGTQMSKIQSMIGSWHLVTGAP